jgi:hypothetical protein
MSRAWRIGYMAGRIIAIPLMILVALGVAWAVGAVVRGITDNDESSKSATTASLRTARLLTGCSRTTPDGTGRSLRERHPAPPDPPVGLGVSDGAGLDRMVRL